MEEEGPARGWRPVQGRAPVRRRGVGKLDQQEEGSGGPASRGGISPRQASDYQFGRRLITTAR
jgi:hypothetical protein